VEAEAPVIILPDALDCLAQVEEAVATSMAMAAAVAVE
jgi:hypothetical protein